MSPRRRAGGARGPVLPLAALGDLVRAPLPPPVPPDQLSRVLEGAIRRRGDRRLAEIVYGERRLVVIWIRQSDPRQVIEHVGSRAEQLYGQYAYLGPYDLAPGHPQIVVLDAGAETARASSGLTAGDLTPEALKAWAARAALGAEPEDGTHVVKGGFHVLVRLLATGWVGALVVASLDRGAREDADAGLLVRLLREHEIVVVENGTVFDPRLPHALNYIRGQLQNAIQQGDRLIVRSQETRYEAANQVCLRNTTPSGMLHSAPEDPTYAARLRVAGLERWTAPEVLAQHRAVHGSGPHVPSRPLAGPLGRALGATSSRSAWLNASDPPRAGTYILPYPCRLVWVTVCLRIAWLRRLQSFHTLAWAIRAGVCPLDAQGAPAVDLVDDGGALASSDPTPAGADAVGETAAEQAVRGDDEGLPADLRARTFPVGVMSDEEAAWWQAQPWPEAYRGRVPVIRANIWRHDVKARWVRVSPKALREWFAAAALYGRFEYVAHGLAALTGDPDRWPDVKVHNAFPAPAGPADEALVRRLLEASPPRPALPRRGGDAGAQVFGLGRLYCANPYAGRAGNVRRDGARAGAPANRAPDAPQDPDCCGLHLGAAYVADGTYAYQRLQCAAERGHPAAVSAVVEDVAAAAVCAALDPDVLVGRVAAWDLAARLPADERTALREEVRQATTMAEAAISTVNALYANGNTRGAELATTEVRKHTAHLEALERSLAAAERVAQATAEVADADWARIRTLAADLPPLFEEARAADRAVDAAVRAAEAANDGAAAAALREHGGLLRALFAILGVVVEVRTVGAGTVEEPTADEHGAGPTTERPAVVAGGAAPSAVAGAPRPGPSAGADALVSGGETPGADPHLAAAALGRPTPGGASHAVTVRFANGFRITRYADLAWCGGGPALRLWAYARLATAPEARRDAAAACAAAELAAFQAERRRLHAARMAGTLRGQAARGRPAAPGSTWTAAHVRAAAIHYAVREFPHHAPLPTPTTPPIAVPSDASSTAPGGAVAGAEPAFPGWTTLAHVAAAHGLERTAVRDAFLDGVGGG